MAEPLTGHQGVRLTTRTILVVAALAVILSSVGFFTIGAAATNDENQTSPSWPSFEAMNAFYVSAFLRSESFGLRRIRRADFPQFRTLRIQGTEVRSGDVQLVSLLKHVEPVVYQTAGNPTKLGMENYDSRPLDHFERRSLETLRSGDELVYENRRGRARAMGAIRAQQQCLRCHSVEVGALLGAFSYQLRAVRAEP